MVNRWFSLVLILLLFCPYSKIHANESAEKYFPSTIGSSWVYVDQDGNEITRTAVEGEEIAGETFRAFNYEPTHDKPDNYIYHIHPTLFKVDDKGIKFMISDETNKAYKERIMQELKSSFEETTGRPDVQAPDAEITVEVVTQDFFYFLSTPTKLNEEWDSMRIKPTIKVLMDMGSKDVDPELAGISTGSIVYFTIFETGIIRGKETVETTAGTFNDCLKIEYQTKTVVPSFDRGLQSGFKVSETVSKLWLAPNVGIVKFLQEYQTPLISEFDNSDPTTIVKTLELKKYEIKTDAAEGE